jgi:hypothetical protein
MLKQEINMHRTVANMLSELRTEWASWSSIWSFLVHLNDLDFYKGVDEQSEMCIASWASCREGVHGQQSWPIECVGVTYDMKVTELIAGIQADKVTIWVERGSLRYRGLSRAVEKWLPQIRDNREAIAAELRYRGTSPVMSGGCRLGLGKGATERTWRHASGVAAHGAATPH